MKKIELLFNMRKKRKSSLFFGFFQRLFLYTDKKSDLNVHNSICFHFHNKLMFGRLLLCFRLFTDLYFDMFIDLKIYSTSVSHFDGNKIRLLKKNLIYLHFGGIVENKCKWSILICFLTGPEKQCSLLFVIHRFLRKMMLFFLFRHFHYQNNKISCVCNNKAIAHFLDYFLMSERHNGRKINLV